MPFSKRSYFSSAFRRFLSLRSSYGGFISVACVSGLVHNNMLNDVFDSKVD